MWKCWLNWKKCLRPAFDFRRFGPWRLLGGGGNAECGTFQLRNANCGLRSVETAVQGGVGRGKATEGTEKPVGVSRSRPAVRPHCGWSCGHSRVPRSCLAAEGNATDWKVGFDGVVEP